MIPELNKNALTSAIERIKILEAERDAAVAESNRRDQKWMEVIDSIVGRELRYTLATITDPPGFDLVPDLQDFISDLRAKLQTAEQQAKEAYQKGVDESFATNQQLLKDANFFRSESRAALSVLKSNTEKLKAAEQQLGQVREEVKRLTEALESTHMGRAVVHWMRAYDSVKCSDDNDENCQILRIPKNLIPKGATLVEAYETAKQFVIIGTPESDDESHNCDAMGCSTLSHVVARVNKSPATPSDGCGKGRTDKERLDQWSDDDKKELARIEAQSKEEAFAVSANSVDVAAFTERVNQIVDAGVTKHSIYCEITRSDGSVHMLPDPVKVGDVEWQLRYGKPESVRWQAASVIGFYRTFFSLPYKSRLEVMSKILAASSSGEEGGE